MSMTSARGYPGLPRLANEFMEAARSLPVTMQIRLLPAIACSLLLVACSSTHYKITLRDGREFMTASKPEFSPKTGYYKFRGLNDKDSLIRADEILMMNEL